MPKSLASNWKIVANNVDMSAFADDVQISLEKEQVDVSGFGGTREFLPGIEDATISVEMFFGQGTNEPHTVLYPLYAGGSAFPFYVQENRSAGTSATNQICGGTASLYTYPPGASLNEPTKYTLDFKPAPNSAFRFGTVFPP